MTEKAGTDRHVLVGSSLPPQPDVDSDQATVVDSAGTRTAADAARVPGEQPTSTERSDLTAMHLRICAFNAPRLAPTGVDVDGRSVPSLEVEHRR